VGALVFDAFIIIQSPIITITNPIKKNELLIFSLRINQAAISVITGYKDVIAVMSVVFVVYLIAYK
jgi:hypothetical protein